jgi:hypothetical protein
VRYRQSLLARSILRTIPSVQIFREQTLPGLLGAANSFSQDSAKRIDALMKQYYDYANITFQKDPEGKVTGLLLKQAARTADAKKIK